MSKCMIDELRGCDEATLENLMGEGTTLESMEAESEKLCAGNAGERKWITVFIERPVVHVGPHGHFANLEYWIVGQAPNNKLHWS